MITKMNTLEIERGLAGKMGDNIIFLGCHPESSFGGLMQQAKRLPRPAVVILNTLNSGDDSKKLGHWITLYINFDTLTIGYFDSYNLEPRINSLSLHDFIQARPYMTVCRLRYRL